MRVGEGVCVSGGGMDIFVLPFENPLDGCEICVGSYKHRTLLTNSMWGVDKSFFIGIIHMQPHPFN